MRRFPSHFSLIISTFTLALSPLGSSAAQADVVTLVPTADNTLYESLTGADSNGGGQYIFVGRVATGERRRALLRFDLSSIPARSTINSARLQLNMSRTIAGATNVTLHRVLRDWSEGDVDAPGQEGGGADSQPGSTTWIHTSFPDQLWSSAGGDFDPLARATTSVNGVGNYVWQSNEMAADVADWVQSPSQNFGWLLRGNESVATTAKRFGSSENLIATQQPTLRVDFTPPCPGDLNADRVVNESDLGQLLSNWQAGPGGDLTGDGLTDEADLGLLLSVWLSSCP